MVGVGRGKIVHDQGQVKLVVTEVVRFFPVPKPGELKLVSGLAVAEENEDEAPVGGLLSPDLGQLKRLLVETDAFLQIEDIEIVVREAEFH